MRTIQHELRRLTRDQVDIHDKLRDQQAQVSAVESFAPMIREYLAYAVRKDDIDSSTLLSLVVDPSTTLTLRLAALEDITQRLQEDELAASPLLQQVQQLETTTWLQKERIIGATGRMDRIEEYTHTRWKEMRDELQARQRELSEIQTEQERLEAEVRDAVKKLEQKWEATPGALEERLTKSIGKLTAQVELVEQMVHAITTLVTVVSEHNLKLSAWQSTLEQVIIQFLGKKERLDIQIDATAGTEHIGINTDHSGVSLSPALITQYPQVSQRLALILMPLTPAVRTQTRSPSPYCGGSRKSPQLMEKEAVPPTSSKSSAVVKFQKTQNHQDTTPDDQPST